VRILVVDDSKAMRALIRRSLDGRRFDEAEIEEARNGREALEAIRANRPDLVLANWNMPEMSGIELLEILNRDCVPLRFGFVTSDETIENRARASAAGACFVIGKPFTRAGLRRAVSAATAELEEQGAER
jgi:two-component system, chemotaxis family, chemotaxis protein CheY